MERMLTTDEAAAALATTRRTLEKWRYLRQGPPYVKAGALVRYRETDLAVWIAAQTVTPRG